MVNRKAKNISYIKFLDSSREDIASNKLAIAQFQRNFVWMGHHIRSVIDSIKSNDKGFYLGSIVIQRSPKGNSGSDYVVDGQQRLVTLSLIAKALKEKLDSKKDKTICDRIIFFSGKTPRVQFSRKTLNKAYISIINNSHLESYDESQSRLLKSYKIIENEITKVRDYEDFLYKLINIEFVVIKCSNTNSIYQLFESLNSKGQKLSPVELTKNALLGAANLSQPKINSLNAKWEKIESSFESKNSKVVWFSKFLRHNWFSIGGYISENKLFEQIKQKIKEIGPEKYSDQILLDSGIYLSLRKAEIKKSDFSSQMSESAWKKSEYLIKLIKELQLDQVYAVLLSLLKYGKKHSDYFLQDKFFKDINRIWSFLILIKYSKISPSSYEKVFADFCFNLHNNQTSSFKETKCNFFKKLQGKLPNKLDFVEKVNAQIKCTGERSDEVNFKNNNEIIRIILLNYLSGGNEIIGDFTIEHIIPKGNLVKWKNISKKNIQNVEQIERYKLGNLTLLKNDQVANENFDEKYKLAYENSNFLHNKNLKEYRDLFNSVNPGKAVEIRGKKIAEEIYDIYYNNINNNL